MSKKPWEQKIANIILNQLIEGADDHVVQEWNIQTGKTYLIGEDQYKVFEGLFSGVMFKVEAKLYQGYIAVMYVPGDLYNVYKVIPYGSKEMTILETHEDIYADQMSPLVDRMINNPNNYTTKLEMIFEFQGEEE